MREKDELRKEHVENFSAENLKAVLSPLTSPCSASEFLDWWNACGFCKTHPKEDKFIQQLIKQNNPDTKASASSSRSSVAAIKSKYKNTNPIKKLHEGEPYFFLRSQDIHSTFAVRQYAEAVGVLDPKGKSECLAFADRMERWQDENPNKVKQPD